MRSQHLRIARREEKGPERAIFVIDIRVHCRASCHTALARSTSCRSTALRFSRDALFALRAALIVGTSFMIAPSRCSGTGASRARPVGEIDPTGIRLTLSNSLRLRRCFDAVPQVRSSCCVQASLALCNDMLSNEVCRKIPAASLTTYWSIRLSQLRCFKRSEYV